MTWPDAEAILLKVLRECLENEDIGPSGNFFAMGGDSLLALDVIAALRKHGWRISMRDVLTTATVRELAKSAVAESGDRPAKVTDDPIAGPHARQGARPPAGVIAVQPASVLQVGLIYLAELADGPKPYTDFVGLRVQGVFDDRAMRAALRATVARHRALRSCFDLDSFSQAQQLFWAKVDEPVTAEKADDDKHADELIRAWMDSLLASGIAWDEPPMFRCQVIVLASSFRLSVAVHHAIVDGWSFARVIVDLLSYYEAERDGRPVTLPAVPEHAHRDFVTLEQADVTAAEAAPFWLEKASGPVLLLRNGSGRGSGSPPADPTAKRLVRIPRARWTRLRQVADECRVPVKSLLLASHGWALGQMTGRTSVVSGVVVNGRPEIEGADRLVGLFLNTLPVRLPKVSGTWAEMAAAARDAEGECMLFRRYPLALIEQALGRRAFDVSFNFTHFRVFEELTRLSNLRADSWWTYDKTTFPMQVAVIADTREADTRIAVAFDPALLRASAIEDYLALMDEAFRSVTTGGGAK